MITQPATRQNDAQPTGANPMRSPFYAIWERRAFMSVSAATLILENTERELYEMIENGKVPHAIDIAQKGSKRRCVRVLTRTVFDLRSNIRIELTDWPKIVAAILPKHRTTLRSTEIARMLHTDTDQVGFLIKSLCLEPARERTQVNEPHAIKVSSFERFLIERLIV